MSADDRTINRVKKMLALANDPAAADGERDNALRMAYAVMAKHNLELHDVQGNPTGPQENRVDCCTPEPVYCRPWSLQLANHVANLFFCKLYYVRVPSDLKRDAAWLHFVGLESNANAAAEVARVLIESVWREAKRNQRAQTENATWRRSFCTGAAFRIGDRVREMQRNGVALEGPTRDEDGEEIPMLESEKKQARSTALVLVDVAKKEDEANDLWLKANVGTLRTAASRASASVKADAYHSGREFGSSLGLSASKKLK